MANLFLFLFAIITFTVILPFAVILYAFKKASELLFRVALSIDMTGNVLLAELLNDIIIKDNGYKFGNRKETISSVLGKNKQKGTLKRLGKIFANILDNIDKNHCINSIDNNV